MGTPSHLLATGSTLSSQPFSVKLTLEAVESCKVRQPLLRGVPVPTNTIACSRRGSHHTLGVLPARAPRPAVSSGTPIAKGLGQMERAAPRPVIPTVDRFHGTLSRPVSPWSCTTVGAGLLDPRMPATRTVPPDPGSASVMEPPGPHRRRRHSRSGGFTMSRRTGSGAGASTRQIHHGR